jgi:hypothetical protein
MPNVAQVLKAEIARISRKEIRAAVASIRSSSVSLKKSVAQLKRRVDALERENKRMAATLKKSPAMLPPLPDAQGKKPRITAKGIRSLRRKLKFSRDAFAKLVGTTAQTVYLWENKQGALRLRGQTVTGVLALKAMGKREAKAKLSELRAPANRRKPTRRKVARKTRRPRK